MDKNKDRTMGPLTGDGISPEDFKSPYVADHLAGRLPKGLINVNGHLQVAPEGAPKQPEVLTPEQMIDQILGELRTAFLKKPTTVAQCLEPVLELALLQAEVDPEAVREDLPFNAQQVRPGAFAVLHAHASVAEAKAMKVDAEALGHDLAMAERVRPLKNAIGKAYQILDANERKYLLSIAEHIDGGLKRGWSVIQNNGALLRSLGPALAIRQQPLADGLQRRADNERRDELTRADEQTKFAAAAPAGTPPGTPATTVTLQTATPPVATAPRAPGSRKP